MFVDGIEFEAVYETAGGAVWLLSNVKIDGTELLFDGLVVYPVTGQHLNVGVQQMLGIFRSLEEEAKAQGFSLCRVIAQRTSGATPGRMIHLMRRLT